MIYTCTTAQQVRINLSPTNTDGSATHLDAAPTATSNGGDALFVGVSASQVLMVAGTVVGQTDFTVTGTAGGVSVTETHSLNVTAVPAVLGALGFGPGTVQPKGATS